MKTVLFSFLFMAGCTLVLPQNVPVVPADMAEAVVTTATNDLTSAATDMAVSNDLTAAQDMATIDLATPTYSHYSALLYRVDGSGNWSDQYFMVDGSSSDQAKELCLIVRQRFVGYGYTSVSDCVSTYLTCNSYTKGNGWKTDAMNGASAETIYVFYDTAAGLNGIGCYNLGSLNFSPSRWDQ